MIEALNTFLKAIKSNAHILPLIQQANLRVTLCSDEQSIHLLIKNSEISKENEPSTFVIKGDTITLTQLLEGRERLRTLQQKGQLTISASLRTTLLLESLFYLTQTQENFVKIG